MGHFLTWLDFDTTQATYETQVISGCTGSQDFSWGGQLDQRTPETNPNYTLKDEGYVSRNQQQEIHTLLAIIVSYETFLTKPHYIQW
jgi:hypothetical protein